jgi:large subunit ribosomal protein L4
MNVDVVNSQNEKVGTIELSDELFGGRPRSHLVWESVVAANASERRGTHATKTRALVSGSGRKPWRQKGTGRARVGEVRNPLWRKGGTVFGPQPRSYAYQIPKKVERGALSAALSIRIGEGALTIVDELACEERKTKAVADLLERLGASGKVLLVDVKPDQGLERASRNLKDVRIVASGTLMARDVIGARRVIATKAAVERLQEVLSS